MPIISVSSTCAMSAACHSVCDVEVHEKNNYHHVSLASRVPLCPIDKIYQYDKNILLNFSMKFALNMFFLMRVGMTYQDKK